MSRTKEVSRNESPVEANIFFNGNLGSFGVLKGTDGELEDIALPLRFIVVDDGAHRVTGKDGLESGAPKFKSNIAHQGYGTTLKVWLDNSPQTILAEGTWGAICGMPTLYNAKYTKLLYVITDLGQGKILACIHLKGRAFAAWIEATSKKKLDPCGDVSFIVKGTTMMRGEKGVASAVPVFETAGLSADTKAMAEEADRDLQAWFKTQFANPFAEQSHVAEIVAVNEANIASENAHNNGHNAQTTEAYDDLPF